MSQSEVTPVYGATNPGPQDTAPHSIKRFGSVIGLEPDKEQYYRQLHANTWPSVLARLKQSNVQNFTIYVTELAGKRYLFSYFEYTGDDYEADMLAIDDDPEKYKESTAALVDQAHGQVRELLSNYGKIDVIWFDGHWFPNVFESIRESPDALNQNR